LLHAMLRPKPESIDLLQTFLRKGVLELDNAGIEVKNGAGYIELTNNRLFVLNLGEYISNCSR